MQTAIMTNISNNYAVYELNDKNDYKDISASYCSMKTFKNKNLSIDENTIADNIMNSDKITNDNFLEDVIIIFDESVDYHIQKISLNDSNTHIIKINTNVTLDSVSNSPCTSSVDCLSSDEGYVGSYGEHTNKKKKQINLLKSKILENNRKKTTQLDENFECKDENDIEQETYDEYNNISNGSTNYINDNDELNTEYLNKFCFEIDYDLTQTPFYIQELTFDYYEESSLKLYEFYPTNSEVNIDNFKVIFNNNNNNYNNYNYDDFIDISAYLYEIDVNNDYYALNSFFIHDDFNFDEMLKFSNVYEACSLRLFEDKLSEYYRLLKEEADYMRLQASSEASLTDMLAYVDYIPEFVPGSVNYSEDLDQTLLDDHQIDTTYKYYSSSNKTDLSDANAINCDIFDNVYNVYMSGDDDNNDNSEIDLIRDDAVSISSSSARLQIPRYTKSTREQFRKPCVYMLNDGQCLRADCRFAHDLHNITCKYWLEGECLKGDLCEFLHDFALQSSASSSLASSSNLANSTSGTQSNSINSFSFNHHYSSKIKKTQQNNDNQHLNKIKDFNLNTQDFPELSVSLTNSKKDLSIDLQQAELQPQQKQQAVIEVESNSNDDENEIDSSAKTTTPLLNSKFSKTTTNNKKSRKFKDNILVSLSLPALTNTSRKKHIN